MMFRPELIYNFVLIVNQMLRKYEKIKNRCLSLKKSLHAQTTNELHNSMPH